VVPTTKLKIVTKSAGTFTAELTGENPKTTEAITSKLPIEGRANTWGDEIYFTIPVDAGEESPKQVVEVGDIAYWPLGRALCLFFGPTPASRGGEIRPASPVNVFARISGEPKLLQLVAAGERIRIEGA
jgi:hypothetical protein